MSQSSVCHICLKEDAPLSRVTRRSKKNNWLQCDSCKNWLHAECGGYNTTEYRKLTKDCWFKCVVCCLQLIHNSSCEGNADISSFVAQAVSSRASATSVSASKKALAVHEHVELKDHCSSKSQSVRTEARSPDKLAPLSSALQSDKSVISSEASSADNILIVDNINNPAEFASSRRILKEVNNFCPEVKVEFGYSLARGGVAIHTVDRISRDILLEKLPEESFGGGIKHPPKHKSSDTLFVKGVCTSVSAQEFVSVLKAYDIDVVDVRRLTNRISGKPIRVLKVKCMHEFSSRLLESKILVRNSVCVIEKERRARVIRCYNCQAFGHLAKFCNNKRRCEFCSGFHESDERCSKQVCCANCGGNHPSFSPSCSAYISRYELLTKQHTEHQYVSAVASSHDAETSD